MQSSFDLDSAAGVICVMTAPSSESPLAVVVVESPLAVVVAESPLAVVVAESPLAVVSEEPSIIHSELS